MTVFSPNIISRLFAWLVVATLVTLTLGLAFVVRGCAKSAHHATITSNANSLVARSNSGSEKAFDELKKMSESTKRFSHLTALASLREVRGHDAERTKIAIQTLSRENSVGWHEALLMLSEMRELNPECATALLLALRKYTYGPYHETAIRTLARIDGTICKHKLELLKIASIRKDAELSDFISNGCDLRNAP